MNSTESIIGAMRGWGHDGRSWNRREVLQRLAGTAALAPFARWSALSSSQNSAQHSARDLPPAPLNTLSEQDDAFLQELEVANFRYFWEQTNPETGIVRDRCNVRTQDKSDLGSIAATGFGLTAICIGDKRGFISHADARERVLNTLRFHW